MANNIEQGWIRKGNFFAVQQSFFSHAPSFTRVWEKFYVDLLNQTTFTALRKIHFSACYDVAETYLGITIQPSQTIFWNDLVKQLRPFAEFDFEPGQANVRGLQFKIKSVQQFDQFVLLLKAYCKQYEACSMSEKLEHDLEKIRYQFFAEDQTSNDFSDYSHDLVEAKPKPSNTRDAQALIRAIYDEDLDTFSDLLKRGYDINALDEYNTQPIFYILEHIQGPLALSFLKKAGAYGAPLFRPFETAFSFHTPVELSEYLDNKTAYHFFNTLLQPTPSVDIKPIVLRFKSTHVSDHKTHMETTFNFTNNEKVHLLTMRKLTPEQKEHAYECYREAFTSSAPEKEFKQDFMVELGEQRTIELLYHGGKLIGLFVYSALVIPELENCMVINGIYAILNDPTFSRTGLAFFILYRYFFERRKSHPEFQWWMTYLAASEEGYMMSKDFRPIYPLVQTERARVVKDSILRQHYPDGKGATIIEHEDATLVVEDVPIRARKPKLQNRAPTIDLIYLREYLLNCKKAPNEILHAYVFLLFLSCREAFELVVEIAGIKGLDYIKLILEFSRYADQYFAMPLGKCRLPEDFSGLNYPALGFFQPVPSLAPNKPRVTLGSSC